jgi:hypothetical protein
MMWNDVPTLNRIRQGFLVLGVFEYEDVASVVLDVGDLGRSYIDVLRHTVRSERFAQNVFIS